MNVKQPLKQILSATRSHWDHPETRPAVRENFEKMINCRTPALGAEVFARSMIAVTIPCSPRVSCDDHGYCATWLTSLGVATIRARIFAARESLPEPLPSYQRSRIWS